MSDDEIRSQAAEAETATGLLGLPAQFVAAVRNAMDIARMGQVEQSTKTPYEVVHREPTFVLRRYERSNVKGKREARPVVILVPPLMITSEVYDIAVDASAVSFLLERGIDPWVVDFGAPERQEGALQRTLTDHILACSKAVDQAHAATGRAVHLAGYSQGGIFAYLAAAFRRSEGLASVITFGSPVNVHSQVLPGVPDEVLVPLLEGLGSVLASGFSRTAVPAWLTRNTFRLLSPTKAIQNQLEFLRSLSNRDALARKEGQRRFLGGEGFVAWPGPAFREFIEQMIMGNRLFSGGFVVEGQSVTMADITCPVLAFCGENDDIARPPTVRSVADAAPRAEIWESTIVAGHMGLVVGSRAMRQTWPTVAEWIFWREGRGDRPRLVRPLGAVDDDSPTATDDDEAGPTGWLDSAEAVSRDGLSLILGAASEGAEAVLRLGSNLRRQLPRLVRLEGLRRDTRVGLALTLAEQAKANPDDTFFLYEGRAHSYADADRRVDAIVRGLIQIGVRAGDHVGVCMLTRPTALAVVTAVNRLGAIAVLLRPEGDLAAEMRLGGVEHLIADPENAGAAAAEWRGSVYVLGGVHTRHGALPLTAIDMETIDPAQVAVPEWYTPSPGRAEEVAFLFFAGQGDGLRANRITNRRWALSAYGTASAAALTSADTVYSWTSLQHPTGLLVSVSGALAGGARLAMAHGFDAPAFWGEIRRYGATVVFYAGMMLRELVDAPHDAAERKHPVRLFAGSGMPRPLWQRVVERFGPVDVLEFYATTEGNAILANVSGKKVGSCGRPIPGSAAVRVAAWDLDAGAPIYDASGYVRPAEPGEPGMLLAEVERERGAIEGKPMRNAFARGDAWNASGSLCIADADGDHWLRDQATDVIHHRGGALLAAPIEEVLWELPFVSAAAAYGMRILGLEHEVVAVALLLRRAALDPEAVTRLLIDRLDAPSRPVILRIVEELPTTAGYRIVKSVLREQGLPRGEVSSGRIWVRSLDSNHFERLTAKKQSAWIRSLNPARPKAAPRRRA